MTSPWTEEKIERLRELWATGKSGSEIGKKLDLSKNSVVGKAHRLCLDSRPSPILPCGTEQQRRRTALARPTATVAKPLPQPNPTPAPICQPRRSCLFIEGEKGRDFTLYADAPRWSTPAKPESPYCAAHHRRTHIKLQPRVAA